MRFHQETIEYAKNSPTKVFIHKIKYVGTHWHNSLEVLFIVKGSVRLSVEGVSCNLQEEDIVVINANQLHELSGNDCEVAALQFELKPFLDITGVKENVFFACNSSGHTFEQNFFSVKCLFARIIYLATHYPENLELVLFGETCKLVQELLNHFKADEGGVSVRSSKYRERLTNIINYIDEHYMEGCSLGDIAAHEHLTPSYLSSFFEKNMGVNLSVYVNNVKLRHAVQLLLHTDLTIEEISFKSGFANPRAFVSGFRREYGQLPSHYRRNQGDTKPKKTVMDAVDGYQMLEYNNSLLTLIKYLKTSEIDLALERRSNLRQVYCQADVKAHATPLKHTFRTFTSVGSARELLRGDVQAMLKDLQQAVGYEYIKFHGIFDDCLMVYDMDRNGRVKYVFTEVDKVLDFLLSVNIKPLIQFSFLPKAMAAEGSRNIFYYPGSSMIGIPKDIESWRGLINAFMRHIINRYGKNEAEKWLYCVWNEPDSGDSLFGIPIDNLDELYSCSYEETKKLLPEAQFGSPSLIKSYMIEHFRQMEINNDCPPDFYNVHFYPVEGSLDPVFIHPQSSKPIRLSMDPNYFSKFVDHVNHILDAGGRKIYLTEWNFTTSHRDFLNDTCYKAAYIVKCVCESYDELDSFGYWCLSDTISELRLENELFHGGLGLYTMNGIRKPAWYAFSFLARLGDELLDRGEGYFISRKGDKIQILLYNYHHFSEMYSRGMQFDLDSENYYSAFVIEEPLEFECLLTGLEDGAYIMTERIVNREHGSCLDAWQRMGSQPLDNADEVEALKTLSVPDFQKRGLETIHGSLRYCAILEPHEIRFVELRRSIGQMKTCGN